MNRKITLNWFLSPPNVRKRKRKKKREKNPFSFASNKYLLNYYNRLRLYCIFISPAECEYSHLYVEGENIVELSLELVNIDFEKCL